MKKLFRVKYPKILVLIILIILAYSFFQKFDTDLFIEKFEDFESFSYFIAGFLFSFGFTTPFAVGFFITANPENIFLMALYGGIGSLFSDILIFKLIKISFIDEFKKLEKTNAIKFLDKEAKKEIPRKIRNYLLFILAGFVIASPFPDEIGVVMIAGLNRIKFIPFVISSFFLKYFGILAILLI